MLIPFNCITLFKKHTAAQQRGSILLGVMAAVGMVAALGVVTMNMLSGPVRTATVVTSKNRVENDFITASKLIMRSATNIDTTLDNPVSITEPPNPDGTLTNGRGIIPATINSSKNDPWLQPYAYCAWNHGAGNAANGNILAGAATAYNSKITIALISSGPDRTFQTTCAGDPTYVTTSVGSDDIVQTYTFDQAVEMNLWQASGATGLVPNPDRTAITLSNTQDLTASGNTTISGTGKAIAITGDGTNDTITKVVVGDDTDATKRAAGYFTDLKASGSTTLVGTTIGGNLILTGTNTAVIPNLNAAAASTTTKVTNLNADLLDGQDGTWYQNADNLNAGTIPVARLPRFTGGDATTTAAGSVALRVIQLQGNPLSALAPTPGSVISWDGTQWATNQGVTLTGDVTGSTSATVVERLRGYPIPSAAPTHLGQLLTWNGSNAWQFSAAVAASANRVLGWNGTNWAPMTIGGAGGVPIDSAAETDPTVWSIFKGARAPTSVGCGEGLIPKVVGGVWTCSADTAGSGPVSGSNITFPLDADNATSPAGRVISITDGTAGPFLAYNNTDFNTFLGTSAGKNIVSGSIQNTFVGYRAGLNTNDTAADVNTFVGFQAGQANTSGKGNSFFGANAGLSNTNGTDNVAVGERAGRNNTTGSQNTFVGMGAGAGNTTAVNNTFVGFQAGYNPFVAITGGGNVGVGTAAGYNLTSGSLNVLVGESAAQNMTTAGQNVYIGRYAGVSATTGDFNVMLGSGVGYHNQTGANSVVIGAYAAQGPNAKYNLGTESVILGLYAAQSTTSGSTGAFNNFVGSRSAIANTTGANNNFMGYQAGDSNTTGSNNLFLGHQAGRFISDGSTALTTPTANILIGQGARGLLANSSYFMNIGGALYGTYDTDGIYALGDNQANLTVDGSLTVTGTLTASGAGSIVPTLPINTDPRPSNGNILTINSGTPLLRVNPTGTLNVFLGPNSGAAITSGTANVAVGRNNLSLATTANFNTVIGDASGGAITTGSNNILMGTNAGGALTTGGTNIAIGVWAGQALTTQSENVMIGERAGAYSTTSGSTFIGYYAGFSNTTGTSNVYLGRAAGYNNTVGIGNIFIGNDAGYTNTSNYNTFVGTSSGVYNTTGSSNTFIGHGAAVSNTIGSGNTAIGMASGYLTTSGANNTSLGQYAGYGNTTGGSNTFLGHSAGDNNTTGSNNIIIGSGADNLTATTNSYLNIGNALFGSLGNTASMSDNGANLTVDGSLTVTGTLTASGGGIGGGSIANGDYGDISVSGGVWSIDPNAVVTADIANSAVTYAKIQNVSTNNRLLGRSTAGTGVVEEITVGSGLSLSGGILTATGSAITWPQSVTSATGGDVFQITASNHNFLGFSTDANNTSVFLGREAGNAATAVDNNTFVGYQAGRLVNGAGAQNTFIGSLAGQANTTAAYNTFIGYIAGYGNTTGASNTFIGRGSGQSNTTGATNTFVGTGSGGSNTTSSANTFIGNDAARNNTTGAQSVAIGFQALVGPGAGYIAGGGTVAIGYNAGASTGSGSTGADNTFVGASSGLSNSSGANNTFIGTSSGQTNSTGGFNVFLGRWAGFSNNSGTGNVFLGANAGYSNTSASNNLYIGYEAGSSSSTGNNNVFMGNGAGRRNSTGSQSVVIGSDAALGPAGTYVLGTGNTVIGYQAAYSTTSGLTGAGNTLLGYQTGIATTTGANNTFLGYQTGDNNTTGASNILIGQGVDNLTATTSSYLNIGNALFGSLGNTASTSDNTANLTIDGSLTVTGTFTASGGGIGGGSIANGDYGDIIVNSGVWTADTTSQNFDGNWGQRQTHAVLSNPNSVTRWGVTYINGPTTNIPHSGSQGGYMMTMGLGSEYTIGQYAKQLLIARNALAGNGLNYLYHRDNEAGSWGAWAKISAGFADSAGTATLVADGDKGDITVSGTGALWNIDTDTITAAEIADNTVSSTDILDSTIATPDLANDAVTYAKIQNVSTNNRILGRSTAGAGDIEEITIGGGLSLSGGTLSATATGITWPQSVTSATSGDVFQITGSNHNFLGFSTDANNTSVFVGREAGNAATSAASNTFVGYQAGLAATGGSNVALGAQAGSNITTGTGNIMIGTGVQASAAGVTNELRIGNASGQAIRGTLNSGNLSAQGSSWSFHSDQRLKKDITTLSGSLDKIMALRGVTFEWNGITNADTTSKNYGFVAQEVQKVLPDLVHEAKAKAPDGKTYLEMDYNGILPVAVEAIKAQQAEIDALKAELAEIKAMLKQQHMAQQP